jgi:CBS domain-containing protein
MIVEEIAEFLGQVPAFRLLGPGELRELAERVQVEFSPAGTPLLTVGGPPSAFLRIVASGGVKVSLPGAAGEVEIDYRSKGAAIGYLSLFSGERSRVNVAAAEDTVCYLISWEPFHALLERRPDVREFFTKSFIATYLDKAFGDLRASCLGLRNGEQLLFSTPVRTLMRRRPVSAPVGVSIREAARVMARHRVSSLVLTGRGGEPLAIVTDRDLRERVAAEGRDAAAPVAGIMTPIRLAAKPEDTCFDALLTMLRANVHHLPVLEGGRFVGMITNHDLMLLQGNSPISLVREIEHQRDIDGLASAARQVDCVIDLLLREGAKAGNVSRVTTEINDRLVRKALQLVERPLGPAPLPWCWIVFGSEGRREQTFKTDQDNGIIYADTEDPELEERARRWFAAFTPAARDALARGFPPCPAGYTAANPEWCRPLRGWKRAFTEWISTPTAEAVLHSLIFFDFRPLDDPAGLAAELRAHLTAAIARTPAFLGFLAAQIVRNPPPLGFLQRFVVEKEGEHKDRLNLKLKAIAPIVDLARLFALEKGSPETGTLDRLRALRRTHTIVGSYGEELEQVFEFLMSLRLHHQLGQVADGREPDNFVDPDSLSALERKTAREAFALVSRLQNLVIERYRASIL